MIAMRQQFHHDAFLWVELAVSNLIVQVGLYYMQLVSPPFIIYLITLRIFWGAYCKIKMTNTVMKKKARKSLFFIVISRKNILMKLLINIWNVLFTKIKVKWCNYYTEKKTGNSHSENLKISVCQDQDVF